MGKKHKLKKIKKRVKQIQRMIGTLLIAPPAQSYARAETLDELKMLHAEVHDLRAGLESLKRSLPST